MKTFICLGNWGREYKKTIHNVGMDFFEYLIEDLKAEVDEDDLVRCLDFKDQRFMALKGWINQTGENLRKRRSKIKGDIIAIYDDINLSRFKVKLSFGKGTSGHNGIKDLEKYFDKEFARLRIGVGMPEEGMSVQEYVVSPVHSFDLKKFKEIYRAISINVENITKNNAGFLYTDVENLLN